MPWCNGCVYLGPGLLYLGVFLLVPLALIVFYAFMQRGRFGGIVYEPTLRNFTRALDPIFVNVLLDSLVIAGITTVLALLLGYPTAYVIALLPRRWRTVALVAVVLPFWTNFLIRTYAWIVLLNSEGPVNQTLTGSGPRRRAAHAALHQAGGRGRPALRLPAADDPAALLLDRAARP